mmetsp:Transcript_20110/g.43310  ORF Transcript_20110/g.43310 Transcript_20110/m.43310 type:complete len:224 (+) Transcript_20110:6427-7098(+)
MKQIVGQRQDLQSSEISQFLGQFARQFISIGVEFQQVAQLTNASIHGSPHDHVGTQMQLFQFRQRVHLRRKGGQLVARQSQFLQRIGRALQTVHVRQKAIGEIEQLEGRGKRGREGLQIGLGQGIVVQFQILQPGQPPELRRESVRDIVVAETEGRHARVQSGAGSAQFDIVTFHAVPGTNGCIRIAPTLRIEPLFAQRSIVEEEECFAFRIDGGNNACGGGE